MKVKVGLITFIIIKECYDLRDIMLHRTQLQEKIHGHYGCLLLMLL